QAQKLPEVVIDNSVDPETDAEPLPEETDRASDTASSADGSLSLWRRVLFPFARWISAHIPEVYATDLRVSVPPVRYEFEQFTQSYPHPEIQQAYEQAYRKQYEISYRKEYVSSFTQEYRVVTQRGPQSEYQRRY